jgi:serine/threonine protein kinase
VIPESVGNYKLVAPVERDRAGVVYRAVEQGSERPVAVKLIPADKFADAAAREAFLEEARAAAELSHPNIRRIFDAGEAGGHLYVVMEALEGATLKSVLVGGPVEPETAVAWGAELAEALAAAHEAGVAQGDLTPENVFLTEHGTAKLVDTGLWRATVPSGADLTGAGALEKSGVSPGVVAALAPEQLTGQEPDAKSDLFAFGLLLYQMTTGIHPFADADPVQTMHWVLKRAPEPPSRVAPGVSPALDAIIARAMEKEPESRGGSAAVLAASLRALAAGEPLPAMDAAPASAARVIVRMTAPVWVGLGALAVLAALWYVWLALFRG